MCDSLQNRGKRHRQSVQTRLNGFVAEMRGVTCHGKNSRLENDKFRRCGTGWGLAPARPLRQSGQARTPFEADLAVRKKYKDKGATT